MHTNNAVEIPVQAEKVEYFCGPVGRAFGQLGRVDKLSRTMSFYHNHKNTVIGHSNGADVVLKCLNDYRDIPLIESVHLVCGACNSDFETNGLNRLLSSGAIDRVVVYIAAKDFMLWLAHTIPGRLLGYGMMGLRGPCNVAENVRHRVKVVRDYPWNDYGHSDCWEDSEFDQTMQNFI